jgi:aldehyde dehydrogenase (NAD+)
MTTSAAATLSTLLARLGVDAAPLADTRGLPVQSPIDGSLLGHVPCTSTASARDLLDRAATAQEAWRLVPAPRRGELVRRYGDALRTHKDA